MPWLDLGFCLGFGAVVAILVVRYRAAAPRAGSGRGWTTLASLAGALSGGLVGSAIGGGPRRDGSLDVIAILLAGAFALAFALACRRWTPGKRLGSPSTTA